MFIKLTKECARFEENEAETRRWVALANEPSSIIAWDRTLLELSPLFCFACAVPSRTRQKVCHLDRLDVVPCSSLVIRPNIRRQNIITV